MFERVGDSAFVQGEHTVLKFWNQHRIFRQAPPEKHLEKPSGALSTDRSRLTIRWASTTLGAAPTRICSSAIEP